jgi:hypothetical protein
MENKYVLSMFAVVFILGMSIGGYYFFYNNVVVDKNVPVKSLELQEDSIFCLSHSEYWSSEQGQIITRLVNYQGTSIVDANCTMSILYPNKTFFKYQEQSILSTDSYYYAFTTPDVEGVYEYRADCIYNNNTKSKSVMNSFHLSPALNFIAISYQNLSNKLIDMSNLEEARFNNTTYNLTQIKQDTDYIRSNMALSSDVVALQNSVLTRLDSIANFCGDNYTSGSLLCQWVNQSKNQIIEMNQTINQLSNYTQNVILPAIISVNDSVNNMVVNIQNNISIDLSSLENKLNAVLVNTSNIYEELLRLQANISQVSIDISQVSVDISSMNTTMLQQFNDNQQRIESLNLTVTTILNQILYDIDPHLINIENNLTMMQGMIAGGVGNATIIIENENYILYNITYLQVTVENFQNNVTSRFNDVNSTMYSIIEQVMMIENKLDCNNTVNVLCDRLYNLTSIVMNIGGDVSDIDSYLHGDVTDYLSGLDILLQTVNMTVSEMYNYIMYLGATPSELDLYLDGYQSDLSRSVGEVNITARMLSPLNSTSQIELYINDVLNATGYDVVSIKNLMPAGVYFIKARFVGDSYYAQTTEQHTLVVSNANAYPSVVIVTPLDNENINLPYNVTFTVTDDNSDNVSLFLYQNGELNMTLFTDYPTATSSFMYAVSTPTGIYQLVLKACELGTYDLFCINDTNQIFVNLSCVPLWNLSISTPCQTDNTRYVEYSDLNNCGSSYGLPADNGTYVYCDYCTPDLSGVIYDPVDCVSGNQSRYYIDNNYASCCVVTGLASDCLTDYPPYDNITIICSPLASDIAVVADDKPYLADRIDVLADMNMSNATKCWSYVKSENGILQTNPKKTDYSDALFTSKKTETREYFTPVMGQVNAYYTNENLVAYKNFTLGVTCALDDGTVVTGEKIIQPQYDDLRRVTARSAWLTEQMGLLVITVILFVIIILLLAYLIRRR